jgi:hypothetical protein
LALLGKDLASFRKCFFIFLVVERNTAWTFLKKVYCLET